MIDLNNNILIPFKYTDIFCWEQYGYFSGEYEDNWGIINLCDEIVIPFEYNWLSYPDKYGCITVNREVVVPFIYDDITLYEAEN